MPTKRMPGAEYRSRTGCAATQFALESVIYCGLTHCSYEHWLSSAQAQGTLVAAFGTNCVNGTAGAARPALLAAIVAGPGGLSFRRNAPFGLRSRLPLAPLRRSSSRPASRVRTMWAARLLRRSSSSIGTWTPTKRARRGCTPRLRCRCRRRNSLSIASCSRWTCFARAK